MKKIAARLMVCVFVVSGSVYSMDSSNIAVSKLSALTKSRICAYLLAHTQKVKTDKNEAERRPIPLLIQEKIIDYMDTDWNPLPEEMNDWLFQEKKIWGQERALGTTDTDISGDLRLFTNYLESFYKITHLVNNRYLCVLSTVFRYKIYDVQGDVQEVCNKKRDLILEVCNKKRNLILKEKSKYIRPGKPILSPSGRYMFENDTTGTVQVYDTMPDTHISKKMHNVASGVFSFNDRYLLVEKNYVYKLYDVQNNMALADHRFDTTAQMALSKTGRYLLVKLNNEKNQIYDLADDIKPVGSNLNGVRTVFFSPDDQYVFVVSYDKNKSAIYDIRNNMALVGKELNIDPDPWSSISGIFSSDNELLYYQQDNTLYRILIQNGLVFKNMSNHDFKLLTKIYHESVVSSEPISLTEDEIYVYNTWPQNLRLRLDKQVGLEKK